MNRRQFLDAHVRVAEHRGFELGVLTSPFVRKDEGDITYVDRLSRTDLIARYQAENAIVPADIADIDVVWDRGHLADRLEGRFDYAIASHVIEHVPDLVGCLQEVSSVLHPGGRFVVVMPDRRFTFDYLRRVTETADVIDAHMRRATRPSPAQVFDFHAKAVEVDQVAAWTGALDPVRLRHYADLHAALVVSRSVVSECKYHDVHCWVFVPDSFLAVLEDLAALGLIGFACDAAEPTARNDLEFGVVLRKLSPDETPAAAVASFQAARARLAATAGAEALVPGSDLV